LQARLNRQLQSITEKTSAPGPGASVRAKFKKITSPRLHPAVLARPLQYLGMVITAMALTYWLVQWWQLPSVPAAPSIAAIAPSSSSNNKSPLGVTLYANQDTTAAYDLFGNKPLSTDTIFLRGVVATGKNANGSLDGFAIFEMDGKPTNAISIGESLGKGLTLQSIGDESATLLYQGQKLEFKLSKPGGQKATNPKKK
jgi:hypothetical protein